MNANRLYSVEEARALLPQVMPVLERLQHAVRGLRGLRAAVEVAARGVTGDGHLVADPWAGEGDDRAAKLGRTAREALQLLQQWGIEVKDAERGLIDFYHERNGQVVFLCYLLGEPTVQAWHALDGGFAGRQPLED